MIEESRKIIIDGLQELQNVCNQIAPEMCHALGVMYRISKVSLEHKVDNYPISRVDTTKMVRDAGKSYTEIKRNMINGKNDK